MRHSSGPMLALPGRVEEMESTVAFLKITISEMQLQIEELQKKFIDQEIAEKKEEEVRRDRKVIYTKVEAKKPTSSGRVLKWLMSSNH